MHKYKSIEGMVKTEKGECVHHVLNATCNDEENNSYPMKIFNTAVICLIGKGYNNVYCIMV